MVLTHQQIVEENWHQYDEGNPEYVRCDRVWNCCRVLIKKYCIKLKLASDHNQSLDTRLTKCSESSLIDLHTVCKIDGFIVIVLNLHNFL